MVRLNIHVIASRNSLIGFDRFYSNTDSFWIWLLIIVMVLRVILNYYIHYKTDSPSVRESVGLDEAIPKSSVERAQERPYYNTGTPGMGDFEVMEFLLICLFSFWWTHYPDESRALFRMKKLANWLNLLAIPLFLLVIIMFFRLQ